MTIRLKVDVVVEIRSKWSEYFVDKMISETDLMNSAFKDPKN